MMSQEVQYRVRGFLCYWLPVMLVSGLIGFGLGHIPNVGLISGLYFGVLLGLGLVLRICPKCKQEWAIASVFVILTVPWICLGTFLGA